MFRIQEVFDVELRMASFYENPTLVACAAAIDTARDRGPAGAPRSATGPATIGRRDRSAYRARAPQPAPDRQGLAPHLVGLSGDWTLWRTVCLRAAGFPVDLLAALGDANLAAAADAVRAQVEADPAARDRAGAAYAAEFAAALRRLSRALYEAASPAGAAGGGRLAEPPCAGDWHRCSRTPGPRADQAQHQGPPARGTRRELSAALLREERHHRLLRAGGLVGDRR